jgi:hypothetical protein
VKIGYIIDFLILDIIDFLIFDIIDFLILDIIDFLILDIIDYRFFHCWGALSNRGVIRIGFGLNRPKITIPAEFCKVQSKYHVVSINLLLSSLGNKCSTEG